MKSLRYLLGLLALAGITPIRAEILVEDFLGRQVRLEQPARRIVALAPHIVENLYSAGAGNRLVGAVSYSNFPEQARDIPQVGSFNAFSLESLAALQPDLVIMWASGNGMDSLQNLEILDVPVYVSEPRQLADISEAIRDYGLLAGTREKSEQAIGHIEREIDALVTTYAGRRQLSVFYQVWHEPLQTLNGKHLVSSIIDLCGGRNIFADTAALAPRISLEAVLERNPDAIVASGMDIARPEWLDQWLEYPDLNAVSNQALFFIHPDHIQRPTARVLLGARKLCGQLQTARDHNSPN